MKVLLIKLSSFGDVIHTLPALQDAFVAKEVSFDWAVEPAFSEIALLSPAVNRTIDIPLRSLKHQKWQAIKSGALKNALFALREQRYDYIIDAQGLLKSSLVALVAKGRRIGLDRQSIRESVASYFYHDKISVDKKQHAVERTRSLFGQIFDYDHKNLNLNYGIELLQNSYFPVPKQALLFCHGTTWATKHWPQNYWQQLTQRASEQGYTVLLPWGNQQELSRAKIIRDSCKTLPKPQVLPKMSLLEIGAIMQQVKGMVAVDTGLGHLASALNVPCLSLYGPTDPFKTGTYGHFQGHLQATKSCAPCLKRSCMLPGNHHVMPPCFEEITPERVWCFLKPMLEADARSYG